MGYRLRKITTQLSRNISIKTNKTFLKTLPTEPLSWTIEKSSKITRTEDGLVFYNRGKAEVLLFALILALYIILFVLWWWFWQVIKLTTDVENILNDGEFIADTVDTPTEGVE